MVVYVIETIKVDNFGKSFIVKIKWLVKFLIFVFKLNFW